MCLESETKVLGAPKMMTFYKVMRKTEDGKYLPWRHDESKPQAISQRFKRARKPKHWYQSYECGFHGWVSLKGAQAWHSGGSDQAIVRCEGLAHTVGRQNGYRSVVASKMRIIKEVLDTPENIWLKIAGKWKKAEK